MRGGAATNEMNTVQTKATDGTAPGRCPSPKPASKPETARAGIHKTGRKGAYDISPSRFIPNSPSERGQVSNAPGSKTGESSFSRRRSYQRQNDARSIADVRAAKSRRNSGQNQAPAAIRSRSRQVSCRTENSPTVQIPATSGRVRERASPRRSRAEFRNSIFEQLRQTTTVQPCLVAL